MEKKLHIQGKVSGMLKSLLVSYLVTGAVLLLLTFLLYKFDLDEEKVDIGILAVYILSTFAGGVVIGKLVKTRRFFWGLLLGALYFALLLLISVGIYRTVQGGADTVIGAVLCMAGGMLGGMVS